MLSEMTQTGIANSVLFALLATSWLLIFRVTNVVHLAHGTSYLLGGYLGFRLFSNANLAVAAIGAIAGAVLFGVVCELLVYAPLVKRGAVSWIHVISGLALFLLGENLVGIAFGSDASSIDHGLNAPLDLSAIGIGLEIKRVHLVFIAAAAVWLGGDRKSVV